MGEQKPSWLPEHLQLFDELPTLPERALDILNDVNSRRTRLELIG